MRIPLALALSAALALTACSSSNESGDEPAGLVVYSGRSESLVGPLIDQFEQLSGTPVEVRYGDTAELAAQLLEEGANSPADLFFSQDAGALQVMEDEGLTATLPTELVEPVPAKFRSGDDQWVGTSGRARVMVYDTEKLAPKDLPDSVLDLTDSKWRGQVAIAPTNASFQSFVTAMRMTLGDEDTKKWLEGLIANDVQKYENNLAIVDAVNAGQAEIGLVNHYYWYERAAELGAENLKAENAAFAPGDPGNLVNVAGLAELKTADSEQSEEFIAFMLGDQAQEYFAEEVAEYPLVASVDQKEGLPPLSEVDGPDLTLDQLADLRGTQNMLLEVGLI